MLIWPAILAVPACLTLLWWCSSSEACWFWRTGLPGRLRTPRRRRAAWRSGSPWPGWAAGSGWGGTPVATAACPCPRPAGETRRRRLCSELDGSEQNQRQQTDSPSGWSGCGRWRGRTRWKEAWGWCWASRRRPPGTLQVNNAIDQLIDQLTPQAKPQHHSTINQHINPSTTESYCS